MELSNLQPHNLSALVIAGSLIRHSTRGADKRQDSIIAYQGMPFELYPKHEDHQGRLGLRLASLLHQAQFDTRLLVSLELHEETGSSVPKGQCQTFSSVQSLRRQIESLIAEKKPDLIFVGTRNIHYNVWRFIDDSERFSIEVETLPDARDFLAAMLGEESTLADFDCEEELSSDELTQRASSIISKAQADYLAEREARLFATLGVMNSFQADDSDLSRVI